MAESKCNLLPNKWHKPGDKKPCLVNHYESKLEITEPGLYSVSIWAPKEGKKAYFMVLKKSESDPVKKKPENTPENKTEGSVKPIFKDSLFN